MTGMPMIGTITGMMMMIMSMITMPIMADGIQER